MRRALKIHPIIVIEEILPSAASSSLLILNACFISFIMVYLFVASYVAS